MVLKIIIAVLFIGVLASLTSGLFFLLKDFGNNESQRMRLALGIRIILAALLLLCVFYGIQTDQLQNKAPWDSRLHAEKSDVKRG